MAFWKSNGRKAYQVLIVDDDPLMRDMTERILFKTGISSRAVADGSEAVDAFDKDSFSLILMDLQMPDMDGLEATRIIREKEQERGGHVPIIAVTGYAVEGDEHRCRNAGMDDFVTKPIEFPRFLSVIKRHLH